MPQLLVRPIGKVQTPDSGSQVAAASGQNIDAQPYGKGDALMGDLPDLNAAGDLPYGWLEKVAQMPQVQHIAERFTDEEEFMAVLKLLWIQGPPGNRKKLSADYSVAVREMVGGESNYQLLICVMFPKSQPTETHMTESQPTETHMAAKRDSQQVNAQISAVMEKYKDLKTPPIDLTIDIPEEARDLYDEMQKMTSRAGVPDSATQKRILELLTKYSNLKTPIDVDVKVPPEAKDLVDELTRAAVSEDSATKEHSLSPVVRAMLQQTKYAALGDELGRSNKKRSVETSKKPVETFNVEVTETVRADATETYVVDTPTVTGEAAEPTTRQVEAPEPTTRQVEAPEPTTRQVETPEKDKVETPETSRVEVSDSAADTTATRVTETAKAESKPCTKKCSKTQASGATTMESKPCTKKCTNTQASGATTMESKPCTKKCTKTQHLGATTAESKPCTEKCTKIQGLGVTTVVSTETLTVARSEAPTTMALGYYHIKVPSQEQPPRITKVTHKLTSTCTSCTKTAQETGAPADWNSEGPGGFPLVRGNRDPHMMSRILEWHKTRAREGPETRSRNHWHVITPEGPIMTMTSDTARSRVTLLSGGMADEEHNGETSVVWTNDPPRRTSNAPHRPAPIETSRLTLEHHDSVLAREAWMSMLSAEKPWKTQVRVADEHGSMKPRQSSTASSTQSSTMLTLPSSTQSSTMLTLPSSAQSSTTTVLAASRTQPSPSKTSYCRWTRTGSNLYFGTPPSERTGCVTRVDDMTDLQRRQLFGELYFPKDMNEYRLKKYKKVNGKLSIYDAMQETKLGQWHPKERKSDDPALAVIQDDKYAGRDEGPDWANSGHHPPPWEPKEW
ncbi:hypothetical protein CDD82_4743 [Ophiocordyceps australis]|uniref:Uncharacterized protein n=1 Tax=Ophiocordyceps australis TaxID=1399860 RepID=A0A2C5Z4Y2_9HYPO|nr:hypothetical protein CDD82_4743 [Ophiocordyceps australis]